MTGDAEVEELGRAVAGHQEIRRFDVAMHDQPLVGVLHGAADVPDQPHACGGIGALPPAEVVEGLPLDVFHGEPWRAAFERAGIDDARDGRMTQVRQRPLLAPETLTTIGRNPGVAQHLDGHAAADVGAVGQIDDARPALAEFRREAIGPDARADGRCRVARVEHVARQLRGSGVEHRRGAIAVDERQQLPPQVGVAGAGRRDVGGAFIAGQFDRGVEQVLKAVPAGGVHARLLAGVALVS